MLRNQWGIEGERLKRKDERKRGLREGEGGDVLGTSAVGHTRCTAELQDDPDYSVCVCVCVSHNMESK